MTSQPLRKSKRSSNRGTRKSAGKNPQKCGSISAILLKFREIFPAKTALELALRTGADVKHCEKCLAGRAGLGAEFHAELIRSDVGFEILDALMGAARPEWWRGIRRQRDLSAMRRQIDESRRNLERLESEAVS